MLKEEKPSKKKFGIEGGVLVRESNFESKNAKKPEGVVTGKIY